MVAGSVGTTCEGRYSAINALGVSPRCPMMAKHEKVHDRRPRASMSSYSHNIRRFSDDGVSLDLAMHKLVLSVSFRSEYLDNGWL